MAEWYFHYTSGYAFTEILRSKSFWLTNGKFLNDPMDCDPRIEELKPFFDKYISPELLKVVTLASSRPIDAYVTSFSRQSDNLLHWRAYGDDGAGISLGFDSNLLVDVEPAEGYYLDPKIMLAAMPVKYRRDHVDSMIEHLFERVAVAYAEGDPAPNLAVQLLLIPRLLLCGYKDAVWSGEEETRLLHMAISGKSQLKRGFRVNRGNLYDYVVSPFKAEALKIVVIGPKCLFDVSMVEAFLAAEGYKDVRVIKSSLLYR